MESVKKLVASLGGSELVRGAIPDIASLHRVRIRGQSVSDAIHADIYDRLVRFVGPLERLDFMAVSDVPWIMLYCPGQLVVPTNAQAFPFSAKSLPEYALDKQNMAMQGKVLTPALFFGLRVAHEYGHHVIDSSFRSSLERSVSHYLDAHPRIPRLDPDPFVYGISEAFAFWLSDLYSQTFNCYLPLVGVCEQEVPGSLPVIAHFYQVFHRVLERRGKGAVLESFSRLVGRNLPLIDGNAVHLPEVDE